VVPAPCLATVKACLSDFVLEHGTIKLDPATYCSYCRQRLLVTNAIASLMYDFWCDAVMRNVHRKLAGRQLSLSQVTKTNAN